MIQLILIRHGQTAGNLRHNYIGRTDEPLCPEGVANLRQKVAAGRYPAVDLLFCSPMQRCRATGALIYPSLKPQIIEDLRECDFGEFENRNYQDLSGNPAYQKWLDSNGMLPFPGGESREEFVRRSCQGFQQGLAQIAEPQRGAFVVHGGTIMAILSNYASAGYYDFMCPNGDGFSCFWDSPGNRIIKIEPL